MQRLVSVERLFAALSVAALLGGMMPSASAAADDTVKVGVLQSLTGTMAISEVTVKNATLLAIDQINAKRAACSANRSSRSSRTARPIPRCSRRKRRS
jgi:hypothetical protein